MAFESIFLEQILNISHFRREQVYLGLELLRISQHLDGQILVMLYAPEDFSEFPGDLILDLANYLWALIFFDAVYLLRGFEHKGCEFGGVAKQLQNYLSFKIQLCTLLVDENLSRIPHSFIGWTDFSDNKIKQNNWRDENIREPEKPNDRDCHMVASTILFRVATIVPGTIMHEPKISDGKSEQIYEVVNGCVETSVVIWENWDLHDVVDYRKHIDVQKQQEHEWAQVVEYFH